MPCIIDDRTTLGRWLLPPRRSTAFSALNAFTVTTSTPTACCASTWPLGTDLSVFSQAELDAIATRLNSRPRKTLGFATPDEVFSALVDKAANAVTSPNAEGVRYGT
jgi:hypothetical protein